ncbi:MAG: hypothetical protein K1X83_14915 [Oligoflexia bacterium]|nr:hypothetical protein [Oligoflexia bacterium]
MRTDALKLLFCLSALCVPARLHADFNPNFGSDQHAGAGQSQFDSEHVEKKVKFKSVMIGRRHSDFVALCKALQLDGRDEALSLLMDANAYKDEKCLACRPLLRAWALACKPKAKTSKKEKPTSVPEAAAAPGAEAGAAAAEPTATPTPEPTPTRIMKQREPNTQVLDMISRLFNALADDAVKSDQFALVRQGLDKMLLVLRAPDSKTAAEHEYYSYLADYAESPFKAREREGLGSTPEPEPQIGGEEHAKPSVDSLFDR